MPRTLFHNAVLALADEANIEHADFDLEGRNWTIGLSWPLRVPRPRPSLAVLPIPIIGQGQVETPDGQERGGSGQSVLCGG